MGFGGWRVGTVSGEWETVSGEWRVAREERAGPGGCSTTELVETEKRANEANLLGCLSLDHKHLRRTGGGSHATNEANPTRLGREAARSSG